MVTEPQPEDVVLQVRRDDGPPTKNTPKGWLCPGFTLLELLVVVSIIGVLAALMAPALSSTLGASRGFRCQMSLRQVAFDFSLFADEQLHGDRGDDAPFGDRRFRLMTFQESLYGLDEYWSHGDADEVVLTEDIPDPPLRCSEVTGDITLRRGLSAEQWGAISPSQRVSYGFNIRLHRPEVGEYGVPTAEPTRLNSSVLANGMVPLVWDVDGDEAFEGKGVLPQFSGPSLDSHGMYSDEMVWFPSARHNGQVNVAFIRGQVAASRDPLNEPGWVWDYQPVK